MNSRPAARFLKISAVLALLPAAASAHPGHDGGHDLTWDFSGGFDHPLGGIDHMLAMIAVGLWAAQMGGRARWLVPATFLGMMTLGVSAGQQGAAIAGMEQLLAVSLLVFGLMIALGRRMPFGTGLVFTALFAFFHGFAHGTAIPIESNALSYGLGFVTATLLLHGAGFALGGLKTERFNDWAKAAGAGVATIGAILLVTA